MLAGIEVERGLATPFGRYLLRRVNASDKNFQEFVAATGFDPTRDMDEILLASPVAGANTRQGVVLMRGRFNTTSIVAAAKEKGAWVDSYQGATLLLPPPGKTPNQTAIAFENGSIAVAGDEEKVKACLARRGASPALDAALLNKAAELSAAHHAWMVSVAPLPEMAGGVPNANLSGAMKGNAFQAIEQVSGGADFTDGVKVSAEAVTRSEKDAAALADVLRFLASFAQMNRQDATQAPALAAALETLDLKTEGTTTKISFRIPEDQLEKLLQSHPRPARVRPVAAGSR